MYYDFNNYYCNETKNCASCLCISLCLREMSGCFPGCLHVYSRLICESRTGKPCSSSKSCSVDTVSSVETSNGDRCQLFHESVPPMPRLGAKSILTKRQDGCGARRARESKKRYNTDNDRHIRPGESALTPTRRYFGPCSSASRADRDVPQVSKAVDIV